MVEERQTDARLGAAYRLTLAAKVGPFDGLAQHRERAAVGRESLSRGRRVARHECVSLANGHGVDAECFGDAIHVCFDGEDRLRRTEAAKRAVGRCIREHRTAADADVVATVWSRGVNAAA